MINLNSLRSVRHDKSNATASAEQEEKKHSKLQRSNRIVQARISPRMFQIGSTTNSSDNIATHVYYNRRGSTTY